MRYDPVLFEINTETTLGATGFRLGDRWEFWEEGLTSEGIVFLLSDVGEWPELAALRDWATSSATGGVTACVTFENRILWWGSPVEHTLAGVVVFFEDLRDALGFSLRYAIPLTSY